MLPPPTNLAMIANSGMAWSWWVIDWTIHITAFGLVLLHLMLHRRDSATAILWMFISWSFPILGPLLFVLFGINRVPQKAWLKKRSDARLRSKRRASAGENMPDAYWQAVKTAVAADPEKPLLKELNILMNAIVPDFPLLAHNDIQLLDTGDEAFPRMLAAIRGAKHHIHLQTFILGNDEVGREFLAALQERAESGVTVRVLFDRFGSTPAIVSGLIRKFTGVPYLKIVGWTQANPIKRQFQFNLRNHRKLLVIDGREAFTGGLNISANNITRGNTLPDRDYHFALQGPIVMELQYSFLCDWYFMTDEDPDGLLSGKHFAQSAPAGNAMVRLLNGGPVTEVDELSDIYFGTVTQAQRQLIAVTPYFAPPAELMQALRAAALRGVDTRLIVPEENNHRYAGLAGRALYEDLLSAGVRVFERPLPFLHAKAMIMDDVLAVIGTANLDMRSLRLNYESNLAVWDTAFVKQLKQVISKDMALSKEIKLQSWQRRPVHQKIAENFCSLLTPIL